YALASLRRRIRHQMQSEKVATVSGYQECVLHDPVCMERLLIALSINVTAMFRDPGFYLSFRKKVVPILRTYPFIRIWHAGCSTGEEVYSMAILLQEEGLYDKCRIYATDMNKAVLERAEAGIFRLADMQEYTSNYLQAGGVGSFSNLYTARYDHALFRPVLKQNIIFGHHNLATDGSFNEFNVILCRNVLIYFNKTLQERVHKLLYDSLVPFGFLGLGSKESLKFSACETAYNEVEARDRLYRKVR
ncbi:MAG: MCP methyltransferase, CheR-type, partial [uncultured Chloroflexia bacterium]